MGFKILKSKITGTTSLTFMSKYVYARVGRFTTLTRTVLSLTLLQEFECGVELIILTLFGYGIEIAVHVVMRDGKLLWIHGDGC